MQYPRAIARIATAQILEAQGADVVQESALETLTDVLLRYMHDVANAVHTYSELAGRTEPTLNDVLLALEEKDVGVFGTRGLHRYVESFEGDMIEFAQPITSFPVRKRVRALPTFADKGEQPPPHIPGMSYWMPAFPDAHTWQRSPLVDPSDPSTMAKQAHVDEVEKRKVAESAVVALERRVSEKLQVPENAGPSTARRQEGNDAVARQLWGATMDRVERPLSDVARALVAAQSNATLPSASGRMESGIRGGGGDEGGMRVEWRDADPAAAAATAAALSSSAPLTFQLAGQPSGLMGGGGGGGVRRAFDRRPGSKAVGDTRRAYDILRQAQTGGGENE